MVRPVYHEGSQQVGPCPVLGVGHRGPWLLIDGDEAHPAHQPTDALAPDDMALAPEMTGDLPAPAPRRLEELGIDLPHERKVQRALPFVGP